MSVSMRKEVESRLCRRQRRPVPVLVAGIAGALVIAGCSQGQVCKDLSSCGGDPLGTWAQKPLSQDNGKYCQESTHMPPLQDYRMGQPTPVARERVPENTNLDWCYNLVLAPSDMDAVKKHFYWWENLPYTGGLVTYNENGEYSIDFSREARVFRYYSRSCLSQYGHTSNCTKFAEELEKANEGAREYHTFECKDDPKGGCDCSFHIGEANAQAGKYTKNGSTLTHYSTAPTSRFTQASFCVKGDTMELSGLNNSFLWERQSLRTIELVRVNCEDGKQGPGEAGVDCGLRCPNSCPE
jgi:hypothetical protein